MKIHLAHYEPARTGGGWSFQRNFAKAMKDNLSSYEEADIYFITSASMVTLDEVAIAVRDGKKIVLRIDNIIRNSRNRNTGMSRMKAIAELADLIIYQSKFAAKLLHNFLGPDPLTMHDGRFEIILNAIDQDIFNTNNRQESDEYRYLYCKYSSDETKNWEMARVAFQEITNPTKHLNLVGRFDDKVAEYNFDFYQNESHRYFGLVEDPEYMASIYKQSDVLLYSYFNDACSNTLIEALACGLEIKDCYRMLETGGASEIMDKALDITSYGTFNKEYFSLPRMAGEYYEAMAKL